MGSHVHIPRAGDRVVETWIFDGWPPPFWVRSECEPAIVDGKPALRHERQSGVQIYWLGETLGLCADGSVVFCWPPTFGVEG